MCNVFSWELKLFCLLGRSHRSLHLVSELTRETGLYTWQLNHHQWSLFRQSLCLSAIPYSLSFFFLPSGRASKPNPVSSSVTCLPPSHPWSVLLSLSLLLFQTHRSQTMRRNGGTGEGNKKGGTGSHK